MKPANVRRASPLGRTVTILATAILATAGSFFVAASTAPFHLTIPFTAIVACVPGLIFATHRYSILMPWRRVHELAHLSPSDQRAFWRFCRENTAYSLPPPQFALFSFALFLPAFVPLAPILLVPSFFISHPLVVLLLLLVPIVASLAFPVALFRHLVRRTIRREVLSQFVGRQLPASLRIVSCPTCNYNLIARVDQVVVCPECGGTITN